MKEMNYFGGHLHGRPVVTSHFIVQTSHFTVHTSLLRNPPVIAVRKSKTDVCKETLQLGV